MVSGYWIWGDTIDEKGRNTPKVFIKTLKRAEKILETHTHIDGQRIRCQYLKKSDIDSSELGTCRTKTSYLGKNVYVTRSLNTCSVCVQDGLKGCEMCDRFEPLEPIVKATCPICGYRNCNLITRKAEKWNYGEHEDNYRSESKQKNTNHYFCPKCWGIHNIVTRKIIRHKDGFLIPVVMNQKFRPPQDQYSIIHDPDKDAVR